MLDVVLRRADCRFDLDLFLKDHLADRVPVERFEEAKESLPIDRGEKEDEEDGNRVAKEINNLVRRLLGEVHDHLYGVGHLGGS